MGPPGRSLQERLERSRRGRALISALLVVTLASIVVANLPDSRLRRRALDVVQPYLNATALDQSWELFAPDPRRRSIALQARVDYADGGSDTWRPPKGDALIGNYWDYHWQKWQEWTLDANHPRLWKPAAVFIARDRARGGRTPVLVTLTRITSLNDPPGHRPDHGPKVIQAYYALRITPEMLR